MIESIPSVNEEKHSKRKKIAIDKTELDEESLSLYNEQSKEFESMLKNYLNEVDKRKRSETSLQRSAKMN